MYSCRNFVPVAPLAYLVTVMFYKLFKKENVGSQVRVRGGGLP